MPFSDKSIKPAKSASPHKPDANQVINQTNRDQNYADFVRKHWLAHQTQASAEAARITRMARKPN